MNYLTSEQNNPVDNLIEIYNSEYCITLDELPDLKSYPMAEETEVIKGDVNLDGTVSAADAVLLGKYLTNQTSLSTRQSEAAMLTDDNEVNVFDMTALKRILLKN